MFVSLSAVAAAPSRPKVGIALPSLPKAPAGQTLPSTHLPPMPPHQIHSPSNVLVSPLTPVSLVSPSLAAPKVEAKKPVVAAKPAVADKKRKHTTPLPLFSSQGYHISYQG